MSRVVQVVPSGVCLTEGLEIVQDIKKTVISLGLETFTVNEVLPENTKLLFGLSQDDVIFFHFPPYGEYSNFFYVDDFLGSAAKKVLVYFSPPSMRYTSAFDSNVARNGFSHNKQLELILNCIDYALVDSMFSKTTLLELGCSCSIFSVAASFNNNVLADVQPSKHIMNAYHHALGKNILCAGNMRPSKNIHLVMDAFRAYQQHYNSEARLFLVDSSNKATQYGSAICRYIARQKANNIKFSQNVSLDELAAYYCLADVVLSMSEDEPTDFQLLRAFAMGVPVVAYKSGAISETMGSAGIITISKNPEVLASLINAATSETVQKNVISKQKEQLLFFSFQAVLERLTSVIKTIMKG